MLVAIAAFVLSPPQLGWRAGTPSPVLDGNPRWVQLYWKSWENLVAATCEEKEPGPWPPRAFAENGSINFDKTLLISLYARWGWRAHPVSETLTYVLGRVAEDGHVPLLFGTSLSSGDATGLPIASLAALRVAKITGDHAATLVQTAGAQRRNTFIASRYSYAIPADSEEGNPRTGYRVPALYSALPIPADAPGEISAEASALLLQDASALASLYRETNNATSARTADRLAKKFSDALASLWSDEDRRYRSTLEGAAERDSLIVLFGTIGGKAPFGKEALQGLFDPARYYRRTLFPTLPKSDPAYNGTTSTRPRNSYLALRALMDNDMRKDAGRAAESMMAVFESAAGGAGNLYDFYGGETRTPPDGMPPNGLEAGCITIAGLIEAVLGIDVDAKKERVTWFLRRTDRHGLENLRFGDNVVSLICDKNVISVTAEKPFTLEVTSAQTKRTKRFPTGKSSWDLGTSG
jgi:hypothetical protein